MSRLFQWTASAMVMVAGLSASLAQDGGKKKQQIAFGTKIAVTDSMSGVFKKDGTLKLTTADGNVWDRKWSYCEAGQDPSLLRVCVEHNGQTITVKRR